MAEILAQISALQKTKIEAYDEYTFYSYQDLVDRRIILNRFDLWKKRHHDGFPDPIKLGKTVQSRAIWRKRLVHAWIDAKEAACNMAGE